jgi:hypothetical protein
MRVEQGGDNSWAVPSSSLESGSEVLKGELLVGCAVMGLSDSNAPVLFSDIGQMTSANSPGKWQFKKEPFGLGGSNKRQKGSCCPAPRRSRI